MLLELRGVRRRFHRGPETVEALKGVDLSLESGQVGVVLGASGSGKSTLLQIAAGVDRPTEGAVFFQGQRIDVLPPSRLTRLHRHGVGMIFQDFHLLPGLTALQNVQVPLMFSGEPDDGRSEELMRRVEIESRRNFFPRQLSGGEQQRVAIARALIHRPALLLADEPTGNLDSEQGARMVDLFRSISDAKGLAILVATHDQDLTRRADRVWRLRDGAVTPVT